MSTFEELNLNTSLLNAVRDLNYTQPTTIQEKAFPVIMSGKDVCGIAQTGTGKTVAYLLPVLRQWKFTKERFPQIVVMVPTRELVLQVEEVARKLAKYLTFEIAAVFGGVNMRPQAAQIENGVDMVIATPGRLMDLVLNGSLRLKNVKKLIVDEVDEMLNLGFRNQLEKVFALMPERRQNLLFSATLTEDVEQLMQVYFTAPVRVEAAPAGTPIENIAQSAYDVPNFNTKINLLKKLLADKAVMNKVVVFAATKQMADELFEQIAETFPDEIGIIHSNKAQNQRFNAIKRFTDGTYRVLIATDIVARGIDISGVSHVINFDLPEAPEHYIHRIGRTGRADQKGIAVSFIVPKEKPAQEAIESLMQLSIPIETFPGDVDISDVLIPSEIEVVPMRDTFIKLPDIHEGGGAFHEKLEKNKKVNTKVSHTEKMKKKYGKPKTRGAKPKKR